MKKTISTILLSMVIASASGQTMYDGLTFSRNDYLGTARSLGLGNAVTAVGGDLGTVGINPAGSAVAGYSQVTISPGLTMSSATSSFSAYPVGGKDRFINEQRTGFGRMALPNLGFTLNLSTGRSSGLKSVSYGVVMSSVANYTGKMMAGGANDKTSYLSAMAVGADGCDIDIMNGYMDIDGKDIDDWEYAYNNTNYPFNSIVNAQAGAIANYGSSDDPDYYTRYIAATEGYTTDDDGKYDIYLGGPLDQAYGRQTYGKKNDIIFNAGLNFSDNFYLGANLALVDLTYNFDEYFKEAAQDPRDFPIDLLDNNGEEYTINFDNYRSRYSYSSNATGAYLKIGLIAKPGGGLRLGAAIQTPTLMTVDEVWQHAVDIHYTDPRDDASASSPKGTYTYKLRTPYRLNAGAAWTFGGLGMVSADYEMVDYSSMKFSEEGGGFGYDSPFNAVNQDIRDCMGISHQLRLGAEVKPLPGIAFRVGYNFTTTPEYFDSEVLHDKMNALSLGFGYSSNSSFFFDLAGRMTTFSDEYISPYMDYLDDCASPMILNKRSLWNLVATFGWRF